MDKYTTINTTVDILLEIRELVEDRYTPLMSKQDIDFVMNSLCEIKAHIVQAQSDVKNT